MRRTGDRLFRIAKIAPLLDSLGIDRNGRNASWRRSYGRRIGRNGIPSIAGTSRVRGVLITATTWGRRTRAPSGTQRNGRATTRVVIAIGTTTLRRIVPGIAATGRTVRTLNHDVKKALIEIATRRIINAISPRMVAMRFHRGPIRTGIGVAIGGTTIVSGGGITVGGAKAISAT